MARAQSLLLSVENCAKCWVHYDSDTVDDGSLNVASLTDNGTGDTTIVIGNDMSDANYQGAFNYNGSIATASNTVGRMYTYAVGSVRCDNVQNGSFSDQDNRGVVIHGDLA